ncbi:hypothetical protein [Streptomyces sp. NPDC055210]
MLLIDQPANPQHVESFTLDDCRQLFGRLDEWLAEFFQALQSVASDGRECEREIHAAINDISKEKALIAAAPRLRPWTLVIESTDRCVTLLVKMAHYYLRALASATPLEAQKNASDAQEKLDAAALEMEDLGNFTDLLESLVLSENLGNKLTVLMLQAQTECGASDLATLTSAADQRLRGILQAPMSSSGVAGLQFIMQDVAARIYGDQQRFRQIVSAAYTLFTQNLSPLSALATSQDFLPDLRESLLELHDASTQAVYVMNSSSITRQVGRAVVDIAASLVEGPGQLLAIALLAGTGRKSRSYDKLRQDDATGLLRTTRTHTDLEQLVQGFNLNIRTAQAHRMVRYSDDGIEFETRNGSGRLNWHELIDQVLTAYESAMGCMVGLQAALAESGISTHDADSYKTLGISPAEMATIGLIGQGCENVTVTEEADHWRIDLTPPAPGTLSILAGGISSLIPYEILNLTFIATINSQVHVFTGPVAPMRSFSMGDVDGDEFGIAMVRILHYWKYDGKPCITADILRRWTVHQVHLARISGTGNPIPRLRALRSLASELCDTDLVEVLTATMRSVRLGKDADPDTSRLTDKLSDWGSKGFDFQPI